MSNQTTDCCEQCGSDTSTTETAAPDGGADAAVTKDTAATTDTAPTTADARWIDERPVLSGTLPDDMAAAASRFYGAGSVETLADFVDATRAAAGGTVDVADLCRVSEETPHRATTPSETYHFRCFYDGVALARLQSEPVDIRTESPGGATIDIEVAADGSVTAAPDDAVMSFGLAPDAATADGDPTPEDVYGAACPWVKAFPSREAYEAWAAATDAVTVGLPLADGAPVAGALVAEP